MSYEEEAGVEKGSKGRKPTLPASMTLAKAIEFGEYDPEYLATFPEWHQLTRHIQWQYIKTALDNRNQQLIVQWAETVNILDFSRKPHLKAACKNIEEQIQKLNRDRERLFVEYSK